MGRVDGDIVWNSVKVVLKATVAQLLDNGSSTRVEWRVCVKSPGVCVCLCFIGQKK